MKTNEAYINWLITAEQTRERMSDMCETKCGCGHKGYAHSPMTGECHSYANSVRTGTFSRCECREWKKVG